MALPANATLTWQIPTTGTAGLDDDGNPKPATTPYIAMATMKPDTEDPKYFGGSGLQPGQVRMMGRAVKPKFLPELPRHCRMVLVDPVTKRRIQGTLQIDIPLQSKFKGVTNALGSKIAGIFTEDTGQS